MGNIGDRDSFAHSPLELGELSRTAASGPAKAEMNIIADENIPFVREIFSALGTVTCHPGRQMTSDLLAGAHALLVRSVTRVDEKLLAGSTIRFVGTATIGTDHIDQSYLQDSGITFTSAAGSNSTSVAEYVMTALLVLAQKHAWNLSSMTLGIIGVGNIGSKVEKLASVLGLRVLPNDPPLQRTTGDQRFVSLDQILAEAQIITCHVPLTRSGPDATFHLFDQSRLESLKPKTVLFNTSRGPVVDNQALKNRLIKGDLGPVVLDVWENEPQIDVELLKLISLATPHIAGYSYDGKVNGTIMLYRRLCQFLDQPQTADTGSLMPPPPVSQITLDPTTDTEQQLLTHAFTRIYDMAADDLRLRETTRLEPSKRGPFFDSLRKNYPIRREASNTRVILSPPNNNLAQKFSTLAFQI